MARYGFLRTNVSRSATWQVFDVRKGDKTRPNTHNAGSGGRAHSSATFRLMGETVSSPAQARAAFARGPFMYQYQGSNAIWYCKDESDVAFLCEALSGGVVKGNPNIIIRPLKPDIPSFRY